MKKTLVILASSTLLAACGGGGGGSSTDAGPSAAPLSVYAGNWQTPCDDHELDSLTITAKSDGSLEVATKSEYFLMANCSGTPVATQTTTANPTVTYTGSADTPVKLSDTGATTTVRLDKINVTVPSYKLAVTGSGVKYGIEQGQGQWCFSTSATSSTCIHDTPAEPATTNAGGIYISGNTLYLLSPVGNTYIADESYTRK
ncbi:MULTISPECIES: hypothetical protein [unclassified Janthinobacterium]|uniref:hypothetical protein n=1 Tax=unclassified Janthinobacterium TaxID=2610881 RepID=UPI001E3B6545|nr:MULTISPECIES: hypothetical protein [unclassified Janthinobacterium]MCC7645972.1 hypothetical protein [Janthinobacterium sp. EB271-G4-3-1]MCC7692859.1 hypothetical protein [Janthinobacterium sp. EB271-G4-3-2]